MSRKPLFVLLVFFVVVWIILGFTLIYLKHQWRLDVKERLTNLEERVVILEGVE